MTKRLLAIVMLLLTAASVRAAQPPAEVPAFPGAEGFGRFTKGGRGGDVYHVANLDDDGPGSLRQGILTAKGPRTIVFDVAGNIHLKSALNIIEKSNLTIAGQTAPGDGITLCDHSVQMKNSREIVIRYIRMRMGDKMTKPGDFDTLTTNDTENLILDHLSLSWSIDGIHDFRRGKNFTLQWCLLAEAMNRSIHHEGSHAMCASYREPLSNITLHHNIFSTCRDRHPTLGSAGKQTVGHIVDFRNNVIYNWTGKDNNSGTTNFCDNMVVAINNVWRPGPESSPKAQPISIKGDLPDSACGFMSGNVFDGNDAWTQDNYAALNFNRWPTYKYKGTLAQWKRAQPDLGADAPATQPALEAYELDLKYSGASIKRDAVDERLISNIRDRKGKLIDSQKDVGGWPELPAASAPTDTDQDGMPDAWESSHGLDPKNPEDRNADRDSDGYTNLEEYMNSLCPPVIK